MTTEMLNIIDADEYEHFGIRAHRGSTATVGATLPNSFAWDEGECTDDELDGVCVCKVTADTLTETVDRIRREYGWGNAQIMLVGGYYGQWGNDADEYIIRDGVCLTIA